MRGELLSIWQDSFNEIWEPISEPVDVSTIDKAMGDEAVSEFHKDIFCDLYRAANDALKQPLSIELLADIIDDTNLSAQKFSEITASEFSSEIALVKFFEEAHRIFLDEYDSPKIAEKYSDLVAKILTKYNLRYAIHEPFRLVPTWAGLYTSLETNVVRLLGSNDSLNRLFSEYREAFEDMHNGPTSGRIKTCLQKQVNLLEGFGSNACTEKVMTFSDIVSKIDTWPHPGIPAALNALYGFTSDAQGLRHGIKDKKPLRALDKRDLIALTIMLSGVATYMAPQIDYESVYWGTKGNNA